MNDRERELAAHQAMTYPFVPREPERMRKQACVPVPVLEALASAWEDQAAHEGAYDWPGRAHVDALNSCARMLREAIAKRRRGMSEPRSEAVAAARWWAGQLASGRQDNGSRDQSERDTTAMALFASAVGGRTYSDDERTRFAACLAERIEKHLRRFEHDSFEGSWRPDEPQWGSALRTVAIDYGLDRVLADAAEDAGLVVRGSIDLPMKTTMWINPGEVKVGCGYNAPIEPVWREAIAHGGQG